MSHFAEEYQIDLAAGRDPNKKAGGLLAAAPCSRWALFWRHHDRSRDQWTEWEEVQGRELWEKFGATVDEWKQHAKGWIKMGCTYEIKIVQITEREAQDAALNYCRSNAAGELRPPPNNQK